MKKLAIATVACAILQGCATSPYQYKNDPTLSTPANIIEDQSNMMQTDVGDGVNGTNPKYHRGSLGTVFNLGLAAAGAAKPIAGLSPALSAVAYYNAGLDTDSPIHKQPLVFAYWPYNQGDNVSTGTSRFMGYVDEAVNRMANEAGGTALKITDDFSGDFKINAWKIVAEDLGCTSERACVLSVNILGKTYDGYQPAEWFISNGNYREMLNEVEAPVKAEGANHETAWGTVNNGGKNRSQFIFLQDGMEEEMKMERLYLNISQYLPSGFFLYVPPEKDFGISTEYPYMVHKGQQVLFESP